MLTRRALALAALLSTPAFALRAQHAAHPVGTVRFATTCAAAAQRPFTRGVALLHSFAFGPATAAFDDALKRDPQCAIAAWGLAMTAWSNPFAAGNKSAAQITRGLAAVARGRAAGTASARERAYLDAVAKLYEHADSLPQRARLVAYRDAMTALVAREPADTEAQVFAALAMAIAADPADKRYVAQLDAGATLERLAAALPDHPGLAHYIVHAYDVPPLAPRALRAAARYGRIAPDVSHALHMPSHTWTRVGMWEQSIATNVASGNAARSEGSTAEELHADDYRMYAYLQLARDDDATRLLATISSVAARFDPAALGAAAPPAAGYYALAAMPARFALERGDWSRAASLVPTRGAMPFARAVTWFARAIGASRAIVSGAARPVPAAEMPPDVLGTADFAINQLTDIEAQLARAGEGYWAEQVAIQRLGSEAWRAFAGGQRDSALALMHQAADREDVTEKNAITPGPIAPARELLGDMLMEAGMSAEAQRAYEAVVVKESRRFRAIAGAARAARAAGDMAAAKAHERALRTLAAHANGPRRAAFDR